MHRYNIQERGPDILNKLLFEACQSSTFYVFKKKKTFDELFSINFCLSKAIMFNDIGITVCSASVVLLIVIHSGICHINLLMSQFCYFLQTHLHV